MAEGVKLGSAFYEVTADFTKMDADLKKAERSASSSSSAIGKAFGGIGTALTVGFVAAGAAVATAIGVGVSAAAELETATSKLTAQLGLTADEASGLGDVVKNVFANNFGESIGAVGEAVAKVRQNFGDLGDAATQELTEAALTLQGVFDVPVEESTKAVKTMTANFAGLSETQAFDIITRGFQEGGDFAGDLLDTLNEYAPQFAKMGLSADQAMETLIVGSKAGAFNMDKVGDAVKEFSIRAIDGSKLTAEGFKTIGLDADEMSAKIAKGGPAAQEAYAATLTALAKIEDPLARNTAGVALFGTQWEDLGPTVVTAMAEGLKGMQGFEGATKRAAEAASNNLGAAFEGLKRTFQLFLSDAVQPLLPVITDIVKGITAFVKSEQFREWADTVVRYVGIAINAFSSLFEIFTGGDTFIEAKEALATFFPERVADDIIDLVTNLGDTFRAVFRGDISDALYQARNVFENFGTLIVDSVEEWARWIAGWVDSASPDLLDNLGDLWIDFADWLQDTGFKIIDKLGVWAGAFVDWVAPKIPPLLRELGELAVKVGTWIITDALPTFALKLLEWGKAFVEWVAPRIPPLLLELGKLLLDLTGWLVTTALPAIISKLGEWGAAFAAWVPGAIVGLLYELGKLEFQLLEWIVKTVVQLNLKLALWGAAFLEWVARDVLPKLPTALQDIATAIGQWIGEKVAYVVSEAAKLGAGLIKGVQDGIAGALGSFWQWLQSNFIEKIPTTIRQILNLNADTGALALVGERMVEELKIGISNAWPSLEDLWGRLGARLAQAGGGAAVEAYVRLAAAKRGIDPDVAVRVANTEGGVTEWNRMGSFDTGTSFGPFQLHYRGGPNPRSGLGDDFTKLTGRHATQDPTGAIDFALDHARRYGWGAWYGAGAIGITGFEGIRRYAEGGWAGLHGPELAWIGEREPELVIPASRMMARPTSIAMPAMTTPAAAGGMAALAGAGSPVNRYVVPIRLGSQTVETLVFEGIGLLARRGDIEDIRQ